MDTKCLIFSKFTTTPLALFVSSSCGSSIIPPISRMGELCCTEIPGNVPESALHCDFLLFGEERVRPDGFVC